MSVDNRKIRISITADYYGDAPAEWYTDDDGNLLPLDEIRDIVEDQAFDILENGASFFIDVEIVE